MRRWLAPELSAVPAAGALVLLHLRRPPAPRSQPLPGGPRTVVRFLGKP